MENFTFFVIVLVLFSVSNFLVFGQDTKDLQTWQIKVWRLIFIFSMAFSLILAIEWQHSFWLNVFWKDDVDSVKVISKVLMYIPITLLIGLFIWCYRDFLNLLLKGIVKIFSWALGIKENTIPNFLIGKKE